MAIESELQASDIAFWLKKAKEIKTLADLCWNLDETVEQQLIEASVQGIAKDLVQTTVGIDADLKWLYGSLMAFAVQYICIGILIQRDPKRFLHETPGYRIIELAEECGVVLNKIQKDFLKQVENAFKWGQQNPKWNIDLSHEELRSLKSKQYSERLISVEEKQGLEDLFSTLKDLALNKLTEHQKAALLQSDNNNNNIIF